MQCCTSARERYLCIWHFFEVAVHLQRHSMLQKSYFIFCHHDKYMTCNYVERVSLDD